jgi:hypothetical protein
MSFRPGRDGARFHRPGRAPAAQGCCRGHIRGRRCRHGPGLRRHVNYRDIDATFVPHGVVIEEARRVADDLGLPYWWLNEQASIYISGKDDPAKRRVFDHPGLRVSAASPAHIFAMKALAARTRDIDDLRVLADIIGVESAGEALQIYAEFYPDEPVPQRSVAVLRELFG